MSVLLVPLAAQLLLPLVLLLWLWRGRAGGLAGWLVRAAAVAACLHVIALAGLWLLLPWWLPFLLYWPFFALAAFLSFTASRHAPASGRLRALVAGAAATLLVAAAGYVVASRRPPETTPAVDLASPLRGGRYLVVNGGGSELVNVHLAALDDARLHPWRGQAYALDLVAVDHWGLRAEGFWPHDPRCYRIFGRAIHAPCAGRVIAVEDGLPDLPVPETDRRHPTGNHVVLDCGGFWALLAHMRQGSLRVAAGDAVASGMVLGEVGNSGNTSEPHLHLHAQRPGTAARPFDAEPLPMRLDGRFLVRNDLALAP